MKVVVQQLSLYLAEAEAAVIDYFESAAPHLRTLFSAQEFQRFAILIENYAFSKAYEQLRQRRRGTLSLPESDWESRPAVKPGHRPGAARPVQRADRFREVTIGREAEAMRAHPLL